MCEYSHVFFFIPHPSAFILHFMFFTLSTTTPDATELGFLLHKNPARAQGFELPFGVAQVFYPAAREDKCTVALLLEVDAVRLVRGAGKSSGAFDQYVNDRPYVASSFLSVALGKVFRTALNGQCVTRPELTAREYSLEVFLPVVPVRGGEELLRKLFAPLGYEIETQPIPLDEAQPEWGDSRYFSLTLRAMKTVSETLTQLYVLLPVLDDDKHYWVGEDEIEKLLRRGEGWLREHPERELVARRYLKKPHLARQALSQLLRDETLDADAQAETKDAEEAQVEAKVIAPEAEKKIGLHAQRLEAVTEVLKNSGARRVLDLGCGEGRLLQKLLREKQFQEIVGLDVSHRTLEKARDFLKLERMPEMQRARLQLLHGSLTYRDERLKGFDAAAVVEVVEHLDPPRLDAFARVLWGEAAPPLIVVTTPNRDYNVRFETLPAGVLRHRDHRFEWTRDEFQAWAQSLATRFGYDVRFAPLGPLDEEVGAPSQMAVWEKTAPRTES